MRQARNVSIFIKTHPVENRISNFVPISYKGVTVPAGYMSDGLTKLINKYQPRCLRAAFVHDYICETKILPRKTGDIYFYEIMRLDSVSAVKARGMYLAVRAYAVITFKK
jgi:hypothetical protein